MVQKEILALLIREADQMEYHEGGMFVSEGIRYLVEREKDREQCSKIPTLVEEIDNALLELISVRMRMITKNKDLVGISEVQVSPVRDAEAVLLLNMIRAKSISLCTACSTPLQQSNGFCRNLTCPHSDWPQKAGTE